MITSRHQRIIIKYLSPLLLLVIAVFVFNSCSQKTKSWIKNIETFTKLYGYVKYFYPGDEAAALDWDRFGVYGIKKVKNAENSKELKKILEELFLPIAPALKIYESKEQVKFSIDNITPPNKEGMSLIAWQHHGVGSGLADSIYKSARINRKTRLRLNANNFGIITNSFDATPYQGYEIKMKAAVKVAKGIGQLWLRVDKKNKQTGFFDNMRDRPVSFPQWNYYELKGTIDKDAVKVFYGCFLNGPGQLWVDDFQIYVKGKDNDQWIPVSLKNSGFEEDEEGKTPQNWGGMMPGHSFIVSAKYAERGKNSLCIQQSFTTITGPLPGFKPKSKFGEYIDKKIGSGLFCIMPITLYGTDTYTYPQSDAKELKLLQEAIKKGIPEKLSGDDKDVQLTDIVITWNVFQHFYPYFDVIKINWEESLTRALKDADDDKDQLDFKRTLQKLTAGLRDGHLRIHSGDYHQALRMAPINWEIIENKLVVTQILDPNLTNLKTGDVVIALNGIKAADAYEHQAQTYSLSTDGWKKYKVPTAMLLKKKDTNLLLDIKRDDKTLKITLKHSLTWGNHNNLLKKETTLSKRIEEGIYYLNLDLIPMTRINELMPELVKSKAIICDMRGYPNSNHRFINHLLREKENATWMWIPQILYPDYQNVSYQKMGWNMTPVKPTLTAKIIFITDGRAISYAESYLGYIEGYKLATIVGQPTAGTNGNINSFTLPSGHTIFWTGMRVLKHNGSQHHGIGIIPDVLVERTIKGVKEKRDEFLEKALEIARK